MALLNFQGHLKLLRVHDVGTKFGPPTDQIDTEVVFMLDTQPTHAYGFTCAVTRMALRIEACWQCCRAVSITTGSCRRTLKFRRGKTTVSPSGSGCRSSVIRGAEARVSVL